VVDLLRSELLIRAGFEQHGFTTRVGGVSVGPFATLNLAHDVGDDPGAVAENLSRLRQAIGADIPLLRVRQTHGGQVADAAALLEPGADGWTEPPTTEADAICGVGVDAVLGVQVADCAAVLVADPATRAVAAIHAGWRGTKRGVVRNTIKALARSGASPGALVAAIGPSICAGCYEVGAEVARCFPESADPIAGRPGQHALDLANAIEVSLIAAGLTTRNIERIDRCSRCDETLFSHRGAAGAKCGRTLGLIRCYKGKR
jgi:YfiH family protein